MTFKCFEITSELLKYTSRMLGKLRKKQGDNRRKMSLRLDVRTWLELMG